MKHRIVVALGGNAILRKGERGTLEEQLANIQSSCRGLADLIAFGYELVITHGNGPQVGNILLQNEIAAHTVPPMSLAVCGAESQGFLGYLLQQSLKNELRWRGIDRDVVTVVTETVVNTEDRAFAAPSKPVGPFYSAYEAERLREERGWTLKEDCGRGWRRVVASPKPIDIVEKNAIKVLLSSGSVVICCGGGGVPVVQKKDGSLEGMDAVVDKDLAASRLAEAVGAERLMILTDVSAVMLNYGTPKAKELHYVRSRDLRQYIKEKQFAEGSMLPKVKAAVQFVERCGGEAIIAALSEASIALEGKCGTHVVA